MQLEQLRSLDDNPDLIRRACFYVGWKLQSPDSWEYRDLFSTKEGTVTLETVTLENLINKVKQKHETIQVGKDYPTGDRRNAPNEKFASTQKANGSATRRKSKR